MATKQTKNIKDTSTVVTATDDKKIPIIDGNGNVTQITLANIRTLIMRGHNINAIDAGVTICTYRPTGPVHHFIPSKWLSYQDGDYTPVGIGLQSGDKKIIISLTETSLTWSSENVLGGGVTTTSRKLASYDWAGETNTASQLTKSQCSGTGYAPGYCAAFSCLNSNGKGIDVGAWWLPSLAELALIYANMDKINYALSLVGGTQLSYTNYWSSTEYSNIYAWNINFNIGHFDGVRKISCNYRVRPVTAFP